LLNEKVVKIRAIANAVATHQLLGDDDYRYFLNMPANGTLRGFPKSAECPNVLSLVELLDEHWLGERILDGRAELVMDSINSQVANMLLILPSIFYTQLSNAYRANRFSQVLKDLRESLLAELPSFIAFVYNKSGVH
jgi:hypothetical protein